MEDMSPSPRRNPEVELSNQNTQFEVKLTELPRKTELIQSQKIDLQTGIKSSVIFDFKAPAEALIASEGSKDTINKKKKAAL